MIDVQPMEDKIVYLKNGQVIKVEPWGEQQQQQQSQVKLGT